MKNFKVQFIYSLTVLALSVFMFSCSQSDEDVDLKVTENRTELLAGLENGFVMPKGMELSPEEAAEYITNASTEELSSLNESLKIMFFLTEKN